MPEVAFHLERAHNRPAYVSHCRIQQLRQRGPVFPQEMVRHLNRVFKARDFSIRTWLFAVVAATIVPLALFGLWVANREYDRAHSLAFQQLQNVSRALIQAVEREFQHREGTLLTLAAMPALQTGDLRQFYEIASSVVARMPATSGIILADESGQQILNTRRPFGTALPRRGDLTPVNKVFSTQRTWVSDLFTGALMNIPVVGIDIPVMRDGKVVYDLALSVPIQELNQILERQDLPDGWLALIVDRAGTIVSRSADTERWIGKKLNDSILYVITSSTYEGVLEINDLGSVNGLAAWSRSPEWGWSVIISQPKQQVYEALIGGLLALFLAGAIALVSGALFATLIARRISAATGELALAAAEMGGPGYRQQAHTSILEIDSVSARLTSASDLLRERALQRDAAEEHQRLLMAELDHRVKNILASVQALARQTLGHSPEAEALLGRLMALAKAHNMLALGKWRGAEFSELVQTTLAAYQTEQHRITIDGPDVILDAKSTQAMSLILHELTVNAAKYGSLARSEGSLEVRWNTDRNGLTINWTEQGAPKIDTTDLKKGFGSKLIELSIKDIEGKFEPLFLPGGFSCRIDVPLNGSAQYLSRFQRNSSQTSLEEVVYPSTLKEKRILIVEDSALLSEELMQLIRDQGAEVVGPAVSVETALNFLAVMAPDAAILDVNLNGEPAFPIAEALLARSIPFFFLTGYGDPHVWPPNLRQAARLMKPAQSSDVLRMLASALAGDRQVKDAS